MARISGVRMLLAVASLVIQATSRSALVILGATGDNALRENGVWQGLFEAFAGGVFDQAGGVDLHVALNAPHTKQSLYDAVVATLAPLYAELQKVSSWSCKSAGGDCTPEAILQCVQVNIWEGRDANAQAANMTASLKQYDRITLYLSIPPFAFGQWAEAAAGNWGKDRVHVAAEKPFGTSLEDANKLYQSLVDAGLGQEQVHLVDHWLSFFMVRNLPAWRQIIQSSLGVPWSGETFQEVVITEFETRGLAGRGGFFDRVGQVRDMVQSHLLQVMALTLADTASSDAKLEVIKATKLEGCDLGQYDGFLFEPKLSYHPETADATYCNVHFAVDAGTWHGVPVRIQTGKAMGATLYTVELRQAGGPGLITIEIGKEETGLGGIRVSSWPLANTSEFLAPAGGFDATRQIKVKPDVKSGSGYILNYDDPGMYFPKPYAVMAAALLEEDYSSAFVAYPECQESWKVLEALVTSGDTCLDPTPATVQVYDTPDKCGQSPPHVCWAEPSVQDLYDGTFRCDAEHDAKYANVSFYQAKCHPAEAATIVV